MPDLPANTTTPATIAVGGTYSDTLEANGDRDWVRIDLEPGQYVTVSLDGVSLSDPYVRIYDANGNFIDGNDDGGAGLNSEIVVGSAEGGTFYIEAGAYNDSGSGTYQITAEPTVAPLPSGPVDSIEGDRIRTDTAQPITVYFVPAGQDSASTQDDTISEGWSDAEIARVEAALAAIAAVANVRFEVVTDPNADLQLVLDDFQDPGLLGYFFLPSGSAPSVGVFNSGGYGWTLSGRQLGGLGYATIVHEVLHGLGLEHPHDGTVMQGVSSAFGDYGDFNLNQGVYTTMSYNSGLDGRPRTDNYGNEAGPMALDIAALQQKYGANTTHANGDNVYVLPDTNAANSGTAWQTIWDTGGIDTISYSGSRNITIDLRAATLLYEEGGGGFISAADGIAGGYTIANGVVIENATGGSGDDALNGNAADNVLTGNVGNDTLSGVLGDDTLNGGSGNDTVVGGYGNDSGTVSSGTNNIDGNSGQDTLTGGSGVDVINGGSGNDTISGGGSGDTLNGGRGYDTISGGDGADTIIGGLEADTLTGDAGSDTFVFQSLSDSRPGAGTDEITDFENGGVGTGDTIDLSAIDANLAVAGDQAFDLIGTDAFTGTAGQVRFVETAGDTLVQVDQNGDGIADMEILVSGVTGLSADDFIL